MLPGKVEPADVAELDDDMPTETLTAAGYCRVSTAEQAEHGFSLGEQERTLREDAERRGEMWTRAFVDAGLSGRSTEKRLELKAMLDAAERGEFDVLVIPSLDRLGRNSRDLHNIFARLDAAGVVIRSLRGDVDTSTATGKLMTGLMASLAEFESNVIGERTRNGKRGAARQGRANGGPRPFGFDKRGGALVPKPEEIHVSSASSASTSRASRKARSRRTSTATASRPCTASRGARARSASSCGTPRTRASSVTAKATSRERTER